jgi:methyl-accepting chemotaxis protein
MVYLLCKYKYGTNSNFFKRVYIQRTNSKDVQYDKYISKINNILMEYYESNRANTANIFFAQESGGFYLNPKDILPQDYDARKREWYIQTMENTNYISKQYEDLLNGRNVITFARVVAKDNINIGVIGIDKFID